MTSIQDYKNKKKLKRVDEIETRRETILQEIDQNAIRRQNGASEKLDTNDYLDNIAELIGMYNELKDMSRK